MKYDVVIVGGGGHGLATAYYLAKEHGITVLATCQDSIMAEALPHCGETAVGSGRSVGRELDRVRLAEVGGPADVLPSAVVAEELLVEPDRGLGRDHAELERLEESAELRIGRVLTAAHLH